MTPNLIRAAILFGLTLTFVLASNFILFAMIGEINRKLPDGQRISYLFGYYSKHRRILREYKRLYPDGRMALYFKVLLGAGLASMLACAWQLGMFR